MRVVIAFDVSDDRVRYRLVKVLKTYAHRVQKSVFEARDLDRATYLRMRSRAEGVIDARTDSLRYYSLCAGCKDRIESHGIGCGRLEDPDPVEVIT